MKNNPIRDKVKRNTGFYINFIILSILLSYHLVNIAQGLIYNIPSSYSFFGSVPFLRGLCVLTPVFAAIFYALIRICKIRQDEKQDRIFLYALCVLFVLDFILSFQRNNDRVWFCLYNFILTFALGLVYYRLNVFKNGISKTEEKRVFNVLLITTGVIIVFFGFFNFAIHNSFFTFSDLGTFTNAAWRINDDGSQFTFTEEYKDHRGVHFQPILYLLALIFRVHCSPYILIFMQVFFVFGAAVFLYLLAEKLTGNKAASFFIALSFLVSAYTFRTIVYDYHPETMYMMMFFAFLYFAESKNFLLSMLFMCLAVSMKEEAPVYTAMACVFLSMRNRDRRYLIAAACSLIYAFVVIKFVMPAYNPYAGGWIDLLKYNLANFRANYLNADFFLQFFIFLAGVVFLPVFEIYSLIFIFFPAVGLHLARFDRGFTFLFDLHYAAFVVAAVFGSAVYALNKIRTDGKPVSKHLTLIAFLILLVQVQIHLSYVFSFSAVYVASVYLIVLTLLIAAFAGAKKKAGVNLPVFALLIILVTYAGFFNFYREKFNYIKEEHRESIYKAMKYIPEDINTAVIANANIATHLCCRKYIWALEMGKTPTVFLPVIKEKLKEFYMLVYLYDFSYTQEKVKPAERNREILDLASKFGFKYQFIYADNITGVIKFSK
jgi:uncharacterized membrane protein